MRRSSTRLPNTAATGSAARASAWGWSEAQLVVIAILCVTAVGGLGLRWARSGGWWAETLEFTEPLRPEDLVVDLNRAPASDLTLLPEVGEVKAQRIVELRESLGGYTKLEQLIAVHGISQRILQRLAPHLVLVPLATAAVGAAEANVPPIQENDHENTKARNTEKN